MANEEILSSMDELLKDYDVKKLNRGDILKGIVIEVNDKEVTVNINYAYIKRKGNQLPHRHQYVVFRFHYHLSMLPRSPTGIEHRTAATP